MVIHTFSERGQWEGRGERRHTEVLEALGAGAGAFAPACVGGGSEQEEEVQRTPTSTIVVVPRSSLFPLKHMRGKPLIHCPGV